jgi:hypothetical protein
MSAIHEAMKNDSLTFTLQSRFFRPSVSLKGTALAVPQSILPTRGALALEAVFQEANHAR